MKSLVQTTAIFLFASCLWSLTFASEGRAGSLKAALEGADKLEISETQVGRGDVGATFTFEKPDEVAKLIDSFEFAKESHGYCACLGDCKVTFFRGGKKLTSVSYHHGISLRWNGGKWDGDSLFTPESQKAWRTWFKKNGEPRFQDWHEAEIKSRKHEENSREAFLAVFPQNSRKVIEDYERDLNEYYRKNDFDGYDDNPVLLASRAKLAASIPDRQKLAAIISKALGTLSLEQLMNGSWGSGTSEIIFVQKTSELLEAKDFQMALKSSDPATLLGIARLFFFGELSEKYTAKEAGPVAAKLIEAVAQYDRSGNGTWIFSWLGRFTSPEITGVLERVALGELKLPSSPMNLSQNLSFPHFSCLLLSKTESLRFRECLKRVEGMKTAYPDDQLALLVARSFRGEENLLSDDIFDSRSTPVCLGALSFFEKLRTREALDLIITKVTLHDWAAVREESVLTIERMTGKTWFKNQENERAEWHAKDIREWWDKNGAAFQLPEK